MSGSMETVVAGALASDVAGLLAMEPVEWLEELELGAAWLVVHDCMRSRGRLENLLSFHGGQPTVWIQM
jgi:N-acetylglutamate synthase-like GNAT family acetyltransferase